MEMESETDWEQLDWRCVRVEPGCPVPAVGDEFFTQGRAGVYRMRVRKLLRVRVHPEDGALLIDMVADRVLVEPVQEAGES